MNLQQRLLRQYVRENYRHLAHIFPQRDSLHAAYIKVYLQRTPIVPPIPERFVQELSRAYYRFVYEDMRYRLHYLLPDPAYWLYQAEILQDDWLTEDKDEEQLDIAMQDVARFVKRHCSATDYFVFSLACIAQCDFKQITQTTGLSPAAVREALSRIEQVLNSSKFNNNNNKSNK